MVYHPVDMFDRAPRLLGQQVWARRDGLVERALVGNQVDFEAVVVGVQGGVGVSGGLGDVSVA